MSHCNGELCRRTRVDHIEPVVGSRKPPPPSCQCDCDGCVDSPDPITTGLVIDGVRIPVERGGKLQLQTLDLKIIQRLRAQLEGEILALNSQIDRARQREANGALFDRDWYRSVKIARNVKRQQIIQASQRIQDLGGLDEPTEMLVETLREFAKEPGRQGEKAREALRKWEESR